VRFVTLAELFSRADVAHYTSPTMRRRTASFHARSWGVCNPRHTSSIRRTPGSSTTGRWPNACRRAKLPGQLSMCTTGSPHRGRYPVDAAHCVLPGSPWKPICAGSSCTWRTFYHGHGQGVNPVLHPMALPSMLLLPACGARCHTCTADL
jgi:hypothetical protein